MDKLFHGKDAVVTGAGSGIGRSLAKALYQHGANTFAVSLLQHELDSLKLECPNITVICVDLTDWSATEKALKNVPSVDLLVNCAGVLLGGSLLECSEDVFDLTFNVDVKAVLHMMQICAKKMLAKEVSSSNLDCRGAIVNLSSTLSERACLPIAYGASKAAVNQLTRCAAVELGPQNIRVNAILPTLVLPTLVPPTPIGQTAIELTQLLEGDNLAAVAGLHPSRCFPEVDEVVQCALFLLSDKACMINGALLPVDGGLLCT